MFKNALVSVFNKKGLVNFIRPLYKKGLRVVSTGGSADLLTKAGICVVRVKEQTGFKEVMDGRVKSLHPRIYMPLLARKKDQPLLNQEALQAFDLLVCNLYPFEEKKEIEWIDVGGPSMLRAGAKNFQSITVVCDPSDYKDILKNGKPNLKKRRYLASKAFSLLSHYDTCIAKYLSPKQKKPLSLSPHHSPVTQSTNWKVDKPFNLTGQFFKTLRYGENPDQKAVWIQTKKKGLQNIYTHQGQDLSYNNLQDIEVAIRMTQNFNPQACCVAIKHNNPCGSAVSSHLELAVTKALKADPISVFGAIVAVNQTINKKIAQFLSQIFLSAVIAPSYSPAALSIFRSKKKLIVLEWPLLTSKNSIKKKEEEIILHSITGGLLLQTPQPTRKFKFSNWPKNWKVVEGKPPPVAIKQDLLMAWIVCSYLKSNAISIVKKGQTLGLGMGQVNRVAAVQQAISQWKCFHPKVTAPVLASDGFFPFSDSVKLAGSKGIRWIIQPGGSIRDQEVLMTAQKLSVNMILTGQRCFTH